jgi:hypothetical protein
MLLKSSHYPHSVWVYSAFSPVILLIHFYKSFNSSIEIGVTYHMTHPFIVYNIIFSIIIDRCDGQICETITTISGYHCHLKIKNCTLLIHSSLSKHKLLAVSSFLYRFPSSRHHICGLT